MFAKTAGAASCLSGESCMKPANGLSCVSRGACPGSSPSDPNYQECCKNPASNSASTEIIPNERGQKASGDYELNDFLQLAVNVAKWIERIVGSLALLMFVYGGFVLLLSQGSSDKVAKGKAVIVGAVIGLVIVFTSWAVINMIVKGIGGSESWNISPK
ncbi:hypothetical protein HGA34_03215 [Candidatus Falkowbacteria bacterium]|nr:hypothetical protein [Candidatus Falkowbacteria bacterium]